METIEYTGIADRTTWGEGEWDTEPLDKLQWTDPISGLPVMIKRGPLGAWCGYAGIEDPEHPWFEADYDKPDVQVHGGITFTSFCDEGEGDEGERICHVPAEGEAERVWWLGFDTGHYMDVIPGMAFGSDYAADMKAAGIGTMSQEMPSTYKNQAYITTEVLGLARQIAEASQ